MSAQTSIPHSPAAALTVLLIATTGGVAPAALAQVPCRPVVGVIEGDTTFRACALDQRPRLIRMSPLPPLPQVEPVASGYLVLTLRSDGTVDPGRSGPPLTNRALPYDYQVTAAARQWRYEPGLRNGRPVTSQIMVTIRSDTRNDTLPASMEWRYVESAVTDTLSGRWIAAEPVAPLNPQRQDDIHRAVLREFVRQLVLQPGSDAKYCLVLPDDHHEVGDHLASSVPEVGFAPPGCAGADGVRHIRLARAHATESHRVVVTAHGDHLAHWPPGFNGRPFPLWVARCVSVTPPERPVIPQCTVRPMADPNQVLGPQPPPAPPLPFHRGDRPRGDSLLVSIIARTIGSFRNDTIQLVVPPPPSLRARSLQDSARPCGDPRAFSSEPADSLLLVQGLLGVSSLQVLPVITGSPPPAAGVGEPCGAPLPDSLPFVAFLLGDLGAPARAPITLCYTWCDKAFHLLPDVHTPLEQAQIRLRIGDLREGARDGGPLDFRLHLFPVPDDLIPYLVVRSEGRRPTGLRRLRPFSRGVWGDTLGDAPGIFPDIEVWIYLMRR